LQDAEKVSHLTRPWRTKTRPSPSFILRGSTYRTKYHSPLR
jgi:hypothetical protein